MRFRRKKGDGEEEVSGEVVPEDQDPAAWALPADAGVTAEDDTVDIEAVAPATAAGGAGRTDDHLEQTLEHEQAEAVEAGAEADRRAEEARLADEEADAAAAAELEARRAEQEAAKAAEKARAEAEASQRAQEAAEQAAAAQREADERARQEAAEARDAAAAAAAESSRSVSGASITSPGLGSDASPRAAAAANVETPPPAAEPVAAVSGGGAEAGPLAPVLAHPAVQKKPELLVVGGLAAGFVVAKILKAITSP